jgi:hypothetical protein
VLGECVQAKPTRTLGKKSKEAARSKISVSFSSLPSLPTGKFGLNIITCDFFPSRLALSFSLSNENVSSNRTKKNVYESYKKNKTRQDKVSEELLYD